MKILLVAACALIDADGRVLLAERPAGKPMAGLWEFPGGKVDDGERPEETLIRELNEELGIVVKEACLAPLTFASHSYADFHLADAALCLPALGRKCDAAGRAKARLGAAKPAEGISDAARRRAAGVAFDGAVVRQGTGREMETNMQRFTTDFLRRRPGKRFARDENRRHRHRICHDRRRHRRRIVAAVTTLGTSVNERHVRTHRGRIEIAPIQRLAAPPSLPPEFPLCQAHPPAASSRIQVAAAFAGSASGAQPDSQTISKVARRRPSGSAKRRA